jgi:rhodanese-related sulfurtransferase
MDISQSIHTILSRQDIVTDLFYLKFLDRYPDVRKYFTDVDMAQQAVLLKMALTVVAQYYVHRYPAPAERPFLLDVRTPDEHAAGHIPDSTNIPVDELRSRLSELPKDQEIAAYCQVGQRGYLATRILNQSGFAATNVSGGYKTYKLWPR